MRRIQVVLFVALCAALASCGNKGPLVLPDQKPQPTPAQSETSPAQESNERQ